MNKKESPSKKLKNGTEPSGIRVIARAVDILEALAQHANGLTLREIASKVDLPRSTVQRIVKALWDANLVIAASRTSGVRLGPALFALAESAGRFDIAEFTHPLIVHINKEVGETVDVSILGNNKVVIVDRVSGVHTLTAVSAVGGTMPLHASASGKAILAMLPEDKLEKLRRKCRLTPDTKNTITNWDKLEEELTKIRMEGVAYDREECFSGICAVAQVVYSPTGEFGSIAIPVPSDRFSALEHKLVAVLKAECAPFRKGF